MRVRLTRTLLLTMQVVGGAVAGPLGLGILMLPGNTPALIGAKLLADQVVGCVIWQVRQYLAKTPCLYSHRLDSRHRMLPILQTFAHAVCFAFHTLPAAGRVFANQPIISYCSVVVLEISAGGGRWAAGGA